MKKLIIANWKMNCDTIFLQDYAKKLKSNPCEKFDFFISTPSIYLQLAAKNFDKSIKICAQDCSEFENGAYTGQISPKNLKDVGVFSTLIGHSEARKYLNQKDENLNNKIKNAIKNNIFTIYCIGEDLSQIDKVEEVLSAQIDSIPNEANESNLAIAYEPIWAIGTGKVATIESIAKVCNIIKKICEKKSLKNIKILYGGSVNLENCYDILKIKEISGLLIGGMSLKIEEINQIL